MCVIQHQQTYRHHGHTGHHSVDTDVMFTIFFSRRQKLVNRYKNHDTSYACQQNSIVTLSKKGMSKK